MVEHITIYLVITWFSQKDRIQASVKNTKHYFCAEPLYVFADSARSFKSNGIIPDLPMAGDILTHHAVYCNLASGSFVGKKFL
jgi:hypothetical protein